MYVAHSRDPAAVRQIRKLNGNTSFAGSMFLAVAALFYLSIGMSPAWEHNLVRNLGIIAGFLGLMGIARASSTKAKLNAYLNDGSALRAEWFVRWRYRKLVRQIGANWSYNDLFDFQKQVTNATQKWTDEYKAKRSPQAD